jgi:hypothetical protein
MVTKSIINMDHTPYSSDLAPSELRLYQNMDHTPHSCDSAHCEFRLYPNMDHTPYSPDLDPLRIQTISDIKQMP